MSQSILIYLVILVIAAACAQNAPSAASGPEEPSPPSPYVAFSGGEKVDSISDVQARLDNDIPLPPQLTGEWEPVETWVSRKDYDSDTAKVFFSNGVELLAFPVPEDRKQRVSERQVEMCDEVDFVQIGEIRGVGANPVTKEIHGETIEQDAIVTWWQKGRDVTLSSKTMTRDELVEAAKLFVR